MSDQVELIAGDRRTFTLTVTDRITGLPAHIDGSTLFFTIKRSTRNADAAAVIRKSSPSGGITILDTGAEDANKGVAHITITKADWDGFDQLGAQRDYPWDVQEVVAGEPETIMGTPLGDDPIRIVMDVTTSVA
jgi:hypothetical protein